MYGRPLSHGSNTTFGKTSIISKSHDSKSSKPINSQKSSFTEIDPDSDSDGSLLCDGHEIKTQKRLKYADRYNSNTIGQKYDEFNNGPVGSINEQKESMIRDGRYIPETYDSNQPISSGFRPSVFNDNPHSAFVHERSSSFHDYSGFDEDTSIDGQSIGDRWFRRPSISKNSPEIVFESENEFESESDPIDEKQNGGKGKKSKKGLNQFERESDKERQRIW